MSDDEVLEGDVCQIFPASPLTGGHEMMVNLSAMDRYMDEQLERQRLEWQGKPYADFWVTSAFDRWVWGYNVHSMPATPGIAVITSY